MGPMDSCIFSYSSQTWLIIQKSLMCKYNFHQNTVATLIQFKIYKEKQ